MGSSRPTLSLEFAIDGVAVGASAIVAVRRRLWRYDGGIARFVLPPHEGANGEIIE